MAHAYDLGDPWSDAGDGKCTADKSVKGACTKCCNCGDPAVTNVSQAPECEWNVSQWNSALRPLAPLVRDDTATPFYEGPIHPRLKRPVGRRAAQALKALEYTAGRGSGGSSGPFTGPTISGCRYNNNSNGRSITLLFNRTLLAGDEVAITSAQKINDNLVFGMTMMVCTSTGTAYAGAGAEESGDACGCLSWHYNMCEVPADGGAPRKMDPKAAKWSFVPVSVGKTASTLDVDLSGLNHTAGNGNGHSDVRVHAVKFGWDLKGHPCCESLDIKNKLAPCIPGSCGIMTKNTHLPMNPFFAQISEEGKCSCTPPQTCDEGAAIGV
jgi:hypothetical protein